MQTQELEIVKIDPKEYGIEETKAADIAAQFKPMLDKMVELEQEFNEVISLPIDDEDTADKAKELRLKYVKVRTGTEKIHKEQKAFYLSAGRYVDGWKNAQLFASQGIEEKLKAIEDRKETLLKQKLAALREERERLLLPYEIGDTTALGLGSMSEEVWNNFLIGTKTGYEQRKEAQRIAEEQRLAAIEADRIKREEMEKENARLKVEAEAKEKQLAEERAAAEKRQKEIEAKAKKEKDAADKKLKEEREAKEKLEAEIKAKAEQEAKVKKELEEKVAAELKAKQLEEKKAKAAPDKIKLILLADAIDNLTMPELKSEEAAQILKDAESLLVKVSNFIREKTKQLWEV